MKQSKAKAPNVSANSPELLLVADLAGVASRRLAGAFRDPTHLSSHITDDELSRVLGVYQRLLKQGRPSPRLAALLAPVINAAIEIGLAHEREKKGPQSNV
jgi:AraC-like DNA-binding protein